MTLAIIALLVTTTVVIQTGVTNLVMRYVLRIISKNLWGSRTFLNALRLSVIMLILFSGHLIQIAVWALAFYFGGQFESFGTAYYHSAVNFTSLGYGDIVMSGEWRVMGPIEAANGVLLFGVSTASFFWVMSTMFGESIDRKLSEAKLSQTRSPDN